MNIHIQMKNTGWNKEPEVQSQLENQKKTSRLKPQWCSHHSLELLIQISDQMQFDIRKNYFPCMKQGVSFREWSSNSIIISRWTSFFVKSSLIWKLLNLWAFSLKLKLSFILNLWMNVFHLLFYRVMINFKTKYK